MKGFYHVTLLLPHKLKSDFDGKKLHSEFHERFITFNCLSSDIALFRGLIPVQLKKCILKLSPVFNFV